MTPSTQNAAVLQVDDLRVSFRQEGALTHAVKGVSFAVQRGETVALVGESGSGKSVSALSTVSLLGDSAEVSGSVLYDGQQMVGASDKLLRKVRGNDISFIFQEPMTSLNPLHTIEKQLAESLALHQGVAGAEARARILELLDKVGIVDAESRLGAYPHQLSGGQRQRVMIAMALANKPDVLIADEPTTALDVTIQAQILDLLKELKDSEGVGLRFITHDLGIVRRIADRVCVMKQGEIVEHGPTHEIFDNPQHPYTIKLLGAEPSGRPDPVAPDAEVIANSMTGTFEYEKGDVREVPDFNVFFRYYATYPFYSDAIWYLSQMRRWGQIAEAKSDEWFFETAKSVYRPDISLQAARMLVDEDLANEADFPWDSDGFKAPTPATDIIDGIAYDGRAPNAYLESLPIGLKGTQTVSGSEILN